MKRTGVFAAAAVALLIPLVSSSANATDLSGTWVKPPSRLVFAGDKIVIEHKGNTFALKTWTNVPTGVALMADYRCTIGGGPCQVTFENLQSNSMVSKFEWKAYMEDGKLVAELSSEWNNHTPKSQKYIYSLSPDGKTLSVGYVYVDKLPTGPRIVKDSRNFAEVYTRQ